ncbi:MAG TPA: FkbM family methyltransferase [Agriterribacter sp.]|nr:FkbM family methyltransferase [Agriterribacter sp.]HRQ51166.1 FkbM family methyltransferase [Agriterribacter sp.]
MNRKHIPRILVTIANAAAYRFYRFSNKVVSTTFDYYDFETIDVIKAVLKRNSNAVDIGAHRGTILRQILKQAPEGKHIAIEPIPYLYQKLERKFGKKVTLFNLALANETGEATFTVFKDRPAVSGLKARHFDHVTYKKELIKVQVRKLDDLIAQDQKTDLIKIDVEGAELEVLKGARRILEKNKPVVLFEFGKGGSELYNATPELMFDFFDELGYTITLLEYFLKNREGFNRTEFLGQYEKGYNYFFMAYHAKA